MRSTFAGFTMAQLGLQASQAALTITGQNVTNVNTTGYTRQRVDLYSIASGGYPPLYANAVSSQMGWGVEVGGFSQIRDPFLDVRFRAETATLGEVDAELSFLQDMEKIFDEIAVDGLHSQLQDLKTQLQAFSQEAGSPEFEAIVKSSADNLTKLFNQYSSQLDSVHNQQLNDLDLMVTDTVNSLLQNIAELNETIKQDEIHGNPGLELRDQRNLYLDQLSQYIDINVTYEDVEIADGIMVEELTVSLGKDANVVLIDDEKYGEISRNEAFPDTEDSLQINLTYPMNPDVTDPPTLAITVDISEDIGGAYKGYLTMFNSAGEFDNPPNTERGFNYYKSMLDSLANEFAKSFNDANSITTTDPVTGVTTTEHKPIFGDVDPATGEPIYPITAENFKLSEGFVNGDYGLTTSKDPEAGPGQNDNILAMIQIFDQNIKYMGGDPDGDPTTENSALVFDGTFEEFFSNMSTTLGVEKASLEKEFTNYASVVNGISTSKASISSVSLDEEGMNMIKYQQSYNAAARFMTTLDEALDTLINNTGLVGR